MPRALASTLLAALLLLGSACGAAEFRGRVIDRRTWHCDATTNDFGVFRDCEVRFDGERAYVVLPHGVRLVLILDEENISDPHSVGAYDHKRGIRWELDVYDLS
jgi:hypothetical protein